MKITTGRNMKNKSHFSIQEVQARFWGMHGGAAHSYLTVLLKPSHQERARGFGGSSIEAKEYPAELEIHVEELQKMVEAFASELNACYQVLHEHDLMGNLAEAKNKKKQDAANASKVKR